MSYFVCIQLILFVIFSTDPEASQVVSVVLIQFIEIGMNF